MRGSSTEGQSKNRNNTTLRDISNIHSAQLFDFLINLARYTIQNSQDSDDREQVGPPVYVLLPGPWVALREIYAIFNRWHSINKYSCIPNIAQWLYYSGLIGRNCLPTATIYLIASWTVEALLSKKKTATHELRSATYLPVWAIILCSIYESAQNIAINDVAFLLQFAMLFRRNTL